MQLSDVRALLEQQEALLRFERFDSDVAWALGKAMAEMLIAREMPMSVCLKSVAGNTLFAFSARGTTRNNQNWMRRKENSVLLMEKSSLLCHVQAEISGEGVERHGLDARDYVFCGGGFPIRLKTGEFVGVALASGRPHLEDHAFLVDGIAEFLGVDPPRLGINAKL